jgi:hypothetical protein
VLDVPHHSLTLSIDNAYQIQGALYSAGGGGEYWFDRTLALRAGYTGDSYQQHWTAGLGISVDPVEVDYAFAPQGTLGDTHRLSLIVRFGAEGVEGLAAPGNFSANPMDASVSLHWKLVPSGSVVGYNIYVKKPNSQTLALVTKRHLGPNESSVKLNKLLNGQNYTFGVASVSAAGRESQLVTVAAVPGASKAFSPAQGSAPTGFKAAVNLVGLDLTWDKSTDAAGYFLYLADELGKPGKKLTAQVIPDNKVTLKKVNPDKTYSFLLTAVDKSGSESVPEPLSANFSELKKSSLASLLPPAHLAMKKQEGKILLTWDPAGDGMKYNVYVSHDGVNYKLLTKDGIQKTEALLGPLQENIAYYFGITTISPTGQESDKAVQSVLPAAVK